MMIADFHNDILTSDEIELPKFYSENKIVTAIYKGDRSFKENILLARKSKYVAYEDIGYADLNLDTLISSKPVYVGLTWNGENQFGYGCNYSFGLKKKGVDVIKIFNKNNITVDTAHLSKRGFIDVIDNANFVVNSHTLLNSVFSHKRNISDWQIKLIIEKGGLIGFNCCGYFMSNRKVCKINDYIKHILYFYENYGSDNFCIGSDFYGTDYLPSGLENYDGFNVVKDALIKGGMSEFDAQKFLHLNLSNFLSKILNNSNY